MLKELVLKRKETLMGFLIAMFLVACGAGQMIGIACETYAKYRLAMPDPDLLPRVWLDWFNLLDTEMLFVCKRGG